MAYESSFGGAGELAQSMPYVSWIFGPMLRGMQYEAMMDKLGGVEAGYDALKGPQFSSLPYEAAQFNPNLYEMPEEAAYKTLDLQPGMREAQMEALRRMYDQGEGYGAALNEAGSRKAMMNANQMAQAREGAAMANAQARGVGGSGLAIALGQQGAQDAANRGMMGGLEAAQNAALQRMQAAQNYSQGLSQLRGQDTDLAARNAGIINQFNMLNTQARNAARMGNTDIRNQAGMYNTGNINQGRQFNMNRGDRNAVTTSDFNFNRQKAKHDVVRDMIGVMQGKGRQDIDQGNQTQAQIWKAMGQMGGGGGGFGGFGGM